MPDANDEEDDFHLAEFHAADGDDEEAGGLELKGAQAEELRQIFLTTLPQYVEPLRELIEQVLAQEEVEESLLATLGTTVSSILDAADRIGVEDAARPLRVMRDLVTKLAVLEPDDVRDEILEMLSEIEGLSGSTGSERSATIVSALQSAEGLDPSTLERLTAAGLLSVSQLESAKKHEIVAVTGLPEDAVDALLVAVGLQSPTAPSEVDSELEGYLREQVAAEAALVTDRAEVQHLRRRVECLTNDIADAVGQRQKLEEQERESTLRVAAAVREGADAREAVRQLGVRREELEGRARAVRERIQGLTGAREVRERQTTHQHETLVVLRQRVRRLLSAAKSQE